MEELSNLHLLVTTEVLLSNAEVVCLSFMSVNDKPRTENEQTNQQQHVKPGQCL